MVQRGFGEIERQPGELEEEVLSKLARKVLQFRAFWNFNKNALHPLVIYYIHNANIAS